MNEITKLVVNIPEKAYPVYIGSDILNAHLLQPYIGHDQVFIVTNETVAPLYLDSLKAQLTDYQCDVLILPEGERYKTLNSLANIIDALIKHEHRRTTTLIGLGGGVINDMAGFAAACYQRGTAFIQVPTTLLSQVDASIGGKTGVNHPLGKNMIGTFYQPKAVIIDTSLLHSLHKREFDSGLAEIIKIALIADEDFFCWLESALGKIRDKDPYALNYAIKQAVALKLRIVVADEKEVNIRALLNLGHTFAHAIEHSLGYGTWLHGEAVAVGLVLAIDYSCRLGWLNPNMLPRIKNILTMAELPIRLPHSVSAEQLISGMHRDKKKETRDLKLVLLKDIGQAVVNPQIDMDLLNTVILEN